MNPASPDEVIKFTIAEAREKLITAHVDFNNDRFDDSVSRAYYAVFHAMTAVLFSKGFHFSTHGQVIGAFNREFIKAEIFPKSYGDIIRSLFEERQSCDYDVRFQCPKEVAEQDLKDAEMIVNECENYLKSIEL